jgi:hypothetical protein
MNTDRLTVQLVVSFIGLASLLIIGGIIGLAYIGREVPEPLSTLGGAAIGALGTLLARTSTAERRSEEPGRDERSDSGRIEGGMALPIEAGNVEVENLEAENIVTDSMPIEDDTGGDEAWPEDEAKSE